jgi:hypothetical protein
MYLGTHVKVPWSYFMKRLMLIYIGLHTPCGMVPTNPKLMREPVRDLIAARPGGY